MNFVLSEKHKMLQATVRDFDYFALLPKTLSSFVYG